VEKFVAKLSAKREALSAAVFELVAEVGSSELANRLSRACPVIATPKFRPSSRAAHLMAAQVRGQDDFRVEEGRLRGRLEEAEKTSNPVTIAQAVLEVSIHALKFAKFKKAMEGFDRITELLRDEIKNKAVASIYTTNDLLAIMIECARGRQDCLILQDQVEAARDQSRLRAEAIKLKRSL
jgi:hypothetical protein